MTLSATYINIAATGGAGSVMTDLRADELVKLADRIVSQPTSWLPITGHCRNITFTLDECDVIATALRRLAEAGTQPEPAAWQFQCANGAWIACDRPSPSELSDEPDKFRCLYTASPADAGMREALERIQSAYDELCVRFSGVHSDDAMDSVLLRLHAALKALTAPGATTKSDGGVEADMPSNETATDVMAHPSPMGSRSCDENTIACGVAGVAPGPSGHAAGDTTPRPLPGREEIARIIDPIGMSATERSVVVRLLPEEVQRARIALEKADAILSTIAPEAIRADEREKCAKVAEAEYADKNWHAMYRHAAGAIAAAIRGGRS